MTGQGSTGNVIAAVCSFFIPGLGQLIQGRILIGLIVLVLVPVCYFFWFLIVPGIVGALIHLWSIIAAAMYQPPAGGAV